MDKQSDIEESLRREGELPFELKKLVEQSLEVGISGKEMEARLKSLGWRPMNNIEIYFNPDDGQDFVFLTNDDIGDYVAGDYVALKLKRVVDTHKQMELAF